MSVAVIISGLGFVIFASVAYAVVATVLQQQRLRQSALWQSVAGSVSAVDVDQQTTNTVVGASAMLTVSYTYSVGAAHVGTFRVGGLTEQIARDVADVLPSLEVRVWYRRENPTVSVLRSTEVYALMPRSIKARIGSFAPL